MEKEGIKSKLKQSLIENEPPKKENSEGGIVTVPSLQNISLHQPINQLPKSSKQIVELQIQDSYKKNKDKSTSSFLKQEKNGSTYSNTSDFQRDFEMTIQQPKKQDVSLDQQEISLKGNRCSYEDLEELHEIILEERENNEEDDENGKKSCCGFFFKQEAQKNEWLKHFRILVKNSRFLENQWCGDLSTLVDQQFITYNNSESELQELHLNAQNSLVDIKLKRNTAIEKNKKISSNQPSANRTSGDSFLEQQNSSLPMNLKNIIEDSAILKEEVEFYRIKNGIEAILDQNDPILTQSILISSETVKNQQDQAPSQGSSFCMEEQTPNFEKMWNSNIQFSQTQTNQSPPQLSQKSEDGKTIENSNQQVKNFKHLETEYQIKSSGNDTLEVRSKSKFRKSKRNNSIKKSSFMRDEYGGSRASSQESVEIRANTLLMNSQQLEENDLELFQAAVYYKSITFVIEQHLSEDNNFNHQKPLKLIRDNFVEFYTRTYGANLQSLSEKQIIASIQDLKEFVSLFLETIREYYKLDELVLRCSQADRFVTIDNLVNFLCSILFKDDSVYSIIYVSHCHFDKKISLKFFKASQALFSNVNLKTLNVNDKYCLDSTTLQKMLKDQPIQNNDSSINEELSQFQIPYSKAIEHLKKLSHQRSPVHKLKIIIRTQELINESIKEFYKHFNIDDSNISYDADNLVGIFSYILIKSQVYDIVAHCKIIEHFVTKNTLNSQSGYLLVTLQCCLQYISTLNTQN